MNKSTFENLCNKRLSFRFYCEGTAALFPALVSAACGRLDAGLKCPGASAPPAAPAEHHTASTASAWLEPQRLPVRSLRLPPPSSLPPPSAWNFPRISWISVRPRSGSVRVYVCACACDPPEPCPVSQSGIVGSS